MPVVVVLGMHRSGTSLLSSILISLGVNMGDNLLMRGKNQPHGHWEDRDFLNLNRAILATAKGRWNRPPARADILKVRGQFGHKIKALVKRKSKRKLWGWKDPRTSLTIDLYRPYLVSPRYIRIVRQKDAVIQSLQRRHKTHRGWGELYDVYTSRMDDFLKDRPHLVVTYEALMDKRTRRNEISRINDWIGGNGKIEAAMERVKHD